MKRIAAIAGLVLSPFAVHGAIKTEPIPELRPPRAEVPPAAEEKRPLPWVLGGVGVAALAIALAWPRRKPAPPPEPPFAVAQRELKALSAEHSRATPAAVSSVVRRYVAAAFGLPVAQASAPAVSQPSPAAAAMQAGRLRYGRQDACATGSGVTSEEVVAFLVAHPRCPAELIDAVDRFLGECDVAKFAPGATQEAAGELISRAAKLLADLEACRAVPAPAP
jgi:hypothetical protein